ncbi:MAG: divalent-cation tolerance protein CutA [Anaerolineae bacterium]|nr:divalent-cation tolerance protein CutA [Anaerolineae bacterium]
MVWYIQVITTVSSQEAAHQIARVLVEKRLAGCVQIVGPITSTYWWQGEVEVSKEWQCLIKSRQDLFEEIEKAILDMHPYDVPEILATPVAAGNQDYLTWLEGELSVPGQNRLPGL